MSKKTAKELFPDVKVARYNVASWTSENENLFLISREIERISNGNEPDYTTLILTELDHRFKPVREFTLWNATAGNLLLEDPRARSERDDTVTLGLTALIRGENCLYVPYPAVTNLYTRHWKDILPAVTVIESFGPGKNTTPVEKDIYFFRQNGVENAHRLLVFSLKNMIPRKIQDLNFPTDLPWAQLRIGTAMPPIWLEPDKALMIFHGITKINEKYIYNLGRAALIKKDGKYEIRIDREPFITPEYFKDSNGRYLSKELHPELRKVVYCCGGVLKPTNKKKLILFVNVGDMNTFLMEYSIKKLTEGIF